MSDTINNIHNGNPHPWGTLPFATEEMKTTRKALDVAIAAIARRASAEEVKATHDQNHQMLIELRMMQLKLFNLSKAVDDVWMKPEDRAMDLLGEWLDLQMKMTREEITKSFYN